jgi:outer membrane protein
MVRPVAFLVSVLSLSLSLSGSGSAAGGSPDVPSSERVVPATPAGDDSGGGELRPAALPQALEPPAGRQNARILTLDRAIQTALANQPTVRQARTATEAASGRVEQARSGALPQVSIGASYQRTTGNFSPRPGATSAAVQAAPPWSSTTYDYFNFGVTASQLIYDFGQTGGRWRSAEAARDATRSAERTAALTVRLQVEQAFFRARAQKALIAVAETAVANQQKHLEQIQGFVRAGMRPEIDLASVRTDLANARVQLITAQNGYDLAKAQLNQAMGSFATGPYDIADDDLPPVEGEDTATESPAEDRMVAAALDRRPEVVSLRLQRRAEAETLRSLDGTYWPTLSATASATETGIAVEHLVPNWLVGGTLSWSILQGGLTRGQVREARATLAGLDLQLDGLGLQVRLDIEQALLLVHAAKSSIQAAGEAVTNAKDQLRLAEGRYRAGLGNAVELSDSQQAFFTTEAQAVQAAFNLASARAQLSIALGAFDAAGQPEMGQP